MKNIFFQFLILCSAWQTVGQEIPLFTQKLTNSFIYNPSIAGLNAATFTYSYRRNYSSVEGAPEDHLVSIHTPIANHRFGVGVNGYQEDVSFMRITFASVAFAWHVRFKKSQTISIGLSGEQSAMKLSGNTNTAANGIDPVLLNFQSRDPKFDVSFGAHYQNRYVSIGAAINRLSSSWMNKKDAALTNYFTANAQGMIPMRNRKDSFEPYISTRRLSSNYLMWEAGLFYMINNRLIGGLGYRKGNVIHYTLAFRLPKKIMIGYSRETIGNGLAGFVGSTNEIVIRYDFTPAYRKENSIAECKSGDPFGVMINSRFRNIIKNPINQTRKLKKSKRIKNKDWFKN